MVLAGSILVAPLAAYFVAFEPLHHVSLRCGEKLVKDVVSLTGTTTATQTINIVIPIHGTTPPF